MRLRSSWLLSSSLAAFAVAQGVGGGCSSNPDRPERPCRSPALDNVCAQRAAAAAAVATRQEPPQLGDSSGGANFTGRWTLARQDHFDAFAAAQGVPWVLRQLAALDRPQSDIVHAARAYTSAVAGPGGRVETFRHRLFEAGRTQEAEWGFGGEAGDSSSPSAARLSNPLFEAVDVTLQWAGPECPGVLVEIHANTANSAHDVTMYRWLRARDAMVLTMEAANGATAERYFTLVS